MASFIYDSFLDDCFRGNITPSSDTFYGMLVTSAYAANQGSHQKRSAVTNEVSGTGYTSGGAASALTLNKDTTNHRQTLTFAAISWTSATITARGLVYYKRRGGAASADELVAFNDFGQNVVITAGTFVVPVSVYTIQN